MLLTEDTARSLIDEGMTPDEIMTLVQERTVRGPDWRPKKDSAAWDAMELIAQNDGLRMKELSAKLEKTQQSTYRSLIGLQDAGLIANLSGRGYVLTAKGKQWAQNEARPKIKVTSKIAQKDDVLQAAEQAAQQRSLPQDVEAVSKAREALGNMASESNLGKTTKGKKHGTMGNNYTEQGNNAQWTLTLSGKTIGAQFETVPSFYRDRKVDIRVLKNPNNLNLTQMKAALEAAGIKNVRNIQVQGWQADAGMANNDDVVVTFESEALPKPEKPKRTASPGKQLDKRIKRAQALGGRAMRKGRMSGAQRAMNIVQRLQQRRAEV